MAHGAGAPSLASGAPRHRSAEDSTPPHPLPETFSIVLLLGLDIGPGPKGSTPLLTVQNLTSFWESWGRGSTTIPGLSCPQLLHDFYPSFLLPAPSPRPVQPQNTTELLPTSCPRKVGKKNLKCALFPFKQEVCCCGLYRQGNRGPSKYLAPGHTANKEQTWDSNLCSSDLRVRTRTFLYLPCLSDVGWKAPSGL